MDLERLTDQLAKLEGHPPYDDGSNPVRGDGMFARSIEREFGKPIAALIEIRDREVGIPTKVFSYVKAK